MKKKGYTCLNRTGLLILCVAVLNLFQGCTVFRCVKRQTDDPDRINKQIEKGKYFVLYTQGGVYHLGDVRITSTTLMGTISPLSESHQQYRFPPGEKPEKISKEGKTVLEEEVVLVTKLEIPAGSTTFTIPLSAVDNIYVYKTSLRTGSVVAIVFGSIVVALVGLLLIAAPSGGQVEMGS